MKTRNSILFVLVLLLISNTSFSQIKIGIRQGVSASTFSQLGDLCDNNNFSFSYTAGAVLTAPVGKSFAIRPEINYVRKGRINETADLNTNVKTDYKIDYLQIPVLLQYRDGQMLNIPGSVFYINGGPYAAFAFNDQTHPTNGNLTNDSKKTDWGVTLGIGLQAPIFNQNICFDLRYDMGLSKIANQPSDFRTKALNFTVGILF
jgi:hypothetical protein